MRMPAPAAAALAGHPGSPAACPACAGAGLTGKHAKLRAIALTDKLKALSRSTAVGGLQPYRTPDAAIGQQQQQEEARRRLAAAADHAMTQEQLQEQREMEADLEKVCVV